MRINSLLLVAFLHQAAVSKPEIKGDINFLNNDKLQVCHLENRTKVNKTPRRITQF